MKTIAVANRKGGTGKTTISSHLAGALAHRGYTVCLIDTDPQGHAALTVGLRKEPGLYNLLIENANFSDVLRQINPNAISVPDNAPQGHLFLLPSDERTQAIPVMDKNPFNLAQRLEELENQFDYVIIDTAPTISLFDGTIYLAVEAILYVTECETLSLDGLKSGIKQITDFAPSRLKNSLPKIEVLGIVPNKYREKTATHVANLRAVQEKFGDLVWEPIALRTILPEATTAGKLVFSLAPSSDAAAAMWDIADRFERAVETWQSQKQTQ
ncbi:MAG TPA: ParA family protein [Aggregatilineales bacterium]|nr:ParA family protein [Aggregatilineales bacterium]